MSLQLRNCLCDKVICTRERQGGPPPSSPAIAAMTACGGSTTCLIISMTLGRPHRLSRTVQALIVGRDITGISAFA
jgi:hypothetical protein